MVFLVQFKTRAISRDRLNALILLMAERYVQFRALVEIPCKKKIKLRFIPACAGYLQSINAILATRLILNELNIPYEEILVLIVPYGIDVRGRLLEHVKVRYSYFCPHVIPNHPGFQVFELNDPFLGEKIVEGREIPIPCKKKCRERD